MPVAGVAPPMGAKPPMGPPPGGTGPAAAPGGMAGNQMQGMTQVKIGLEALTKALPMLPLGSDIQSAIMKAVEQIGKHLPGAGQGGDPAAMIQMLALMGREAKANPMQAQALQHMGGGMPPGGGGGAMPPPGIGAGAPPLGG
jgi:hypothetical protein